MHARQVSHGSLVQGKTEVVGQCPRGDPSPGSPWPRAEQDRGCSVPSDAGGGVRALSGGIPGHGSAPPGLLAFLCHKDTWFLNAHWPSLEKVRGTLLIAAQPSKWRSAPGAGNTRDLKVSEKTDLFPADFSSGKAAHCFLNTLVKGDTFQGIDPLVQSTCLVDK